MKRHNRLPVFEAKHHLDCENVYVVKALTD